MLSYQVDNLTRIQPSLCKTAFHSFVIDECIPPLNSVAVLFVPNSFLTNIVFGAINLYAELHHFCYFLL